jgi:hypothetical protein
MATILYCFFKSSLYLIMLTISIFVCFCLFISVERTGMGTTCKFELLFYAKSTWFHWNNKNRKHLQRYWYFWGLFPSANVNISSIFKYAVNITKGFLTYFVKSLFIIDIVNCMLLVLVFQLEFSPMMII